MRFLSPFSRYSIQVFESGERVMTDERGFAVMVPQQKPVLAQFDKLGLLDHEQDKALEAFDFSGLPEGVHPLTRVGVWDSEAFCLNHYKDEKERATMNVQIDTRMLELQKQYPTHFIAVETPVAAKPWPSYDEDGVEDILKLQERLGFPAELVRRYEQENLDREEIVMMMSELEGLEAEKEEITVDA